MDKGMKGVVSIQLCLERQLKSAVFPTQVGRWDARVSQVVAAGSTAYSSRTSWYCQHLLNRVFSMHSIVFLLRATKPE